MTGPVLPEGWCWGISAIGVHALAMDRPEMMQRVKYDSRDGLLSISYEAPGQGLRASAPIASVIALLQRAGYTVTGPQQEPLCDGRCGAKPNEPHCHGGPASESKPVTGPQGGEG